MDRTRGTTKAIRMSYWESKGKSDEWYTPKWLFESFGDVTFDMDVAAPKDRTYCYVPAKEFITENSLEAEWKGFVWCNPPYGGRNGVDPWLKKMALHGNGIALVPDRTSADWWQDAAWKCDGALFLNGKIKFVRPDGTTGNQPGNGSTLFAYGPHAVHVLSYAAPIGKMFYNFKSN